MTREEAIEILEEVKTIDDSMYQFSPKYMDALDMAIEALQTEPSVTAEQKTGHWMERRNRATGHIESVCSECGAEEGYPYNIYCGNCGTKMEWGQVNEKNSV